MRLLPALTFTVLALLKTTLAAPDDEFDTPAVAAGPATTLYAWPVSVPSPTPLAIISLSALRTYTPPSVAAHELVRVGAGGKSESWSVVDGAVLLARPASVTVRVDSSGKVWHVEFSGSSAETEEEGDKIKVVRVEQGVTPLLNKPVVLRPDGKIPEKEVEKTMLQKYWWVLLAGVILLVSGGGGGE